MLRRTKAPGLAYAIVRGDKVIHQRVWGRDGEGEPITTHSPFLLGSVSKAFTALLVMQLVEAGRLTLDAPVRHYLPWFWPKGETASRLTVRQLLTHTSGISARDGYVRADRFDSAPGGVQRRARELAHVRLASAPGRRHEYSDANYMILGALVEQISRRSYAQQLRASVLQPLAMRDAITNTADAERLRLAAGYRFFFGRTQRFDPPHDASGLPYGYVGGSLEDLSTFAIAHLNGGRHAGNTVLSPAGVRQMQTGAARVRDNHAYAFGWRDQTVPDLGSRLVWHSGATAGYHSILVLVPERKLAVIVLQNAFTIAKDRLFNAAGFGAARILLGGQPQPTSTDPLIPRTLTALVAVTALLTAILIWSVVSLVRRPREPGRGLRLVVARGAAAVAGCLLLAFTAGSVLPRQFDADLRIVRLFAPDVGLLLLAVIWLSLAVAVIRIAIVVRTAITVGKSCSRPKRTGRRHAAGELTTRLR